MVEEEEEGEEVEAASSRVKRGGDTALIDSTPCDEAGGAMVVRAGVRSGWIPWGQGRDVQNRETG